MIDINKLVNDKLSQMSDEGIIEKAITDGIEKVLIKAVDDAVTGWEFKQTVSKKIANEVDESIKQVDFSTYNGFIVSHITSLLNDVMRDDIKERVEKSLNALFLCQRKELKLSEIFATYREMLCGSIDETEKYERQHFTISVNDDDDKWLKVKMHPEKIETNGYSGDTPDIEFEIMRGYSDKTFGSIYGVRFDGVALDKKLKIGRLDDVELMIIQAVYNDIPVKIDIEDFDDIDTSYDVDF